MSVRDLEFPEDARRARDALIEGLEYDAAFAILGERLSRLPESVNLPPPTTVVRFGENAAAESAVRRDLAGLCARFATTSMISRFEGFSWALLIQRRFVEHWVRGTKARLAGPELLSIRNNVYREIRRHSPTQVAVRLVITQPSPDLKARSEWLAGIYKVRNCLAHRQGVVQIEDADEDDTLRVKWLTPKVTVNGQDLNAVPYTVRGPGQGNVAFKESERVWKIGEVIHLTPADDQAIAYSLALLGNRILSEFESEMNSLVGETSR